MLRSPVKVCVWVANSLPVKAGAELVPAGVMFPIAAPVKACVSGSTVPAGVPGEIGVPVKVGAATLPAGVPALAAAMAPAATAPPWNIRSL